ncbi:MAG: hypothetical protein R3A46_21160 [Thermomicrobiales bacterium]
MDPKLFRSLAWRNIGPHRGGRVVAVAGHPTEKATFYFGGVGGGVWKTTNGGSHWENITDGYLTTSAIGAIAVSNADPNVIYVGTGEATIRGNVSHGDGVYKSTDGGETWTNIGLRDTRHIGDIVIHPKDPDTVYVAALGHAWGTNEERGVFRSTDGGKNWEKILYKSDRAVPSIWRSTSPTRASSTRRSSRFSVIRTPSSVAARTAASGDRLTAATHGKTFPASRACSRKASTARSASRRLRQNRAASGPSSNTKMAPLSPDDYGDTWSRQSEQGGLRGRPWYYMHIYADPSDADTL